MNSARRFLGLIFFVGLVSSLAAGPVLAQSGTWSQPAAGTYNWSTPANWQGSLVANGANNTATFSQPNMTGPIIVTLDSDRTIGSLVFDNPTNTFGWTIAGTTTLTLSNTTTPTIAVNNANIAATVGVNLAGTQGLNKTGPGTLFLSGNNTNLTGGITVSAGGLNVTQTATANPLGGNTITLSGGNLLLGVANLNPIGLTAGTFNQATVVPVGATTTGGAGSYNAYITATMDGGTARTGNTWYERGFNTASPLSGLPMGQTFTSAANPSVQYTLRPSNANNTLMLDTRRRRVPLPWRRRRSFRRCRSSCRPATARARSR